MVVLGAGLVLVSCWGRSAPSPSPRPSRTPGTGWNVLLITIDTLRADHLGAYGYHRDTSPRIDSLAGGGTAFERAYTYWPKTRASIAMMLTGRRPSQSGYSRRDPVILPFNPTLASLLRDAGYRTAAVVDNANLARSLGYAKGFESYREIWEEPGLKTEWEWTRAISAGGVGFLNQTPKDRPFFLWLHYVSPHAPYEPPAPFDRRFLDVKAEEGPRLRIMPGFHGGIPRPLYVPGRRKLGYYLAQYDGEVAAVDQQVGEVLDALEATGAWGRTVIVLTSDHGESLGEHDYYFDHGQNLFDPGLEVPLVVVVPGGRGGQRTPVLASTLDVLPTILDAVSVARPPGLAGESLLRVLYGGPGPKRDRLFAQNDRNQMATLDGRFKLVASFGKEGGPRYALYDREADPGEARDVAAQLPDELRVQRRELERYLEITDREWSVTRKQVAGMKPTEEKMTREAWGRLKALGYVD